MARGRAISCWGSVTEQVRSGNWVGLGGGVGWRVFVGRVGLGSRVVGEFAPVGAREQK